MHKKKVKRLKKSQGKSFETSSIKRLYRDLKRTLIITIITLTTLLIVFCVIKLKYFDYDTFEGQYAEKYPVKGIDISHFNAEMDWNIILKQNISFAYIKATEGTTVDDSNYQYNYDNAKKNNIKVGTYISFSFDVSGKEQAAHFIKTAHCMTGDLIPAIDVEHSTNNLFNGNSVDIDTIVSELKIFENELYKHYKIHPIIYTNRNCYKHILKITSLLIPSGCAI